MVKASATEKVPNGFICGYPTASGGDLYGGSMYIQSAAHNAQAEATLAAAARWGGGPAGSETIPVSVCKYKYQPFREGERMYGCYMHSATRR